MRVDRRTFLRRASAIVAVPTAAGSLSGALVACGDDSSSDLPKGLAEPGRDIPKVAVKMGIAPNGNECMPVIGIRRGYYADAGITITPEPNGAKTDLLKSVTPLLNGQVEVGSAYPPVLVPQLDAVKNVKAFALSDVYYGYRILAPKGKYRTVAELAAEGKPFRDAARAVMGQLRGKKILRKEAGVPIFFDICDDLGGLSKGDYSVTFLENPDIVKAALAGRADFAAPTGAVDIQTLQDNGWEPIIEVRQLLEHLGEETLPLRATHSGFLTTDQYLSRNYETVLRLTAVMYRIIDDLKRDPKGTVAVYRDFVNSYTGNDLSVDSLAALFESIYSLRGFEAAAEFYEDTRGTYYLEPAYDAQFSLLREQDVLKESHKAGDLFVAGRVWRDLRRYQRESDRLFESVRSSDRNLAQRARRLYDQRNYLDSYRLLATA